MSTENKFYKLRRGGNSTPSQRKDEVTLPKSDNTQQATTELNIVQKQAANKAANETPTNEQKKEAEKELKIASQGVSVEKQGEVIDALAKGLDGSKSTEEDAIPQSYHEMVLEGLSHFAPFKVSDLKIGSADWAKDVAKNINMETYSKAKRYADAMMTTADENDIQKGMGSILKDYPVDELVSEDYILGKVKTVDKEGNPVYVFNGKLLYGDDTARKIAKAYAKQHNHSINLKDEEYREAWAKEQGATSFQAYIESVNKAKLDPAYQELVKAYDAYYAENKDAIDAARLASSYAPVPIPTEANTLGAMVAELSLQTDAFVNPTFWRGAASGGMEALRIASGDMSEIFHSAETISALKKYQNGEELNAKENLLVKMFAYSNLLDQTKSELRKGVNAADIGSGAVTGAGYSINMLLEALMLGRGLAGAFAKKGGRKALKEWIEANAEGSLKQALKQELKKSGKEALLGVVDDAIRTPIKAQMWNEFANRRLNQYQFNDGVLMYNKSNPLADMYRAYITVFGERASERFGDFINDGVGLFGRSVAQSRFTRSLFGGKVGKVVDWASEWKPSMAVAQGLKYARIQGLAGEYLSERVNEYLQPMLTGEYFTTLRNEGSIAAYNKHYASILSSESALTTLAVCGAISGTGYFANFAGGLKTGVEIASLRKETRQLINGISNPTIRNAVYSAISTNNYSGLATLNWKEAYKNNDAAFADDATRVTNAVFNSAKIQARKGELAETERLETFLPAVESALASVYRGVDMANPTPTMEVVRAFSVDQKSGQVTPVGNVLFGDIDNKQGIVQVMDRTGVIRDIPVESLQFTRTSTADFLAEQYNLMFSTSIAKERLSDIIENVRGAAEMDYETYAEILADGGFSVYERGDEVSLTDGRDGTIQSVAGNGKYVVQTTDANGKPVTLLVGFESILSEFNDDMAEAQVEASDEGLIDAPIVLPTKQDGSISLDEMDDAQAIADVLPAVVGVGTAEAAVEVIDSEISRLKEEQRKTSSKSVGLDAMVEAKQKAEATTKRIGVLTEARNILMDGIAKPTESETDVDATTEERENHRKRVEAEYDAMSTFDFSRDYRNRMVDSKASRNALWTFVNNIKKALGVSDEAIADIDKKISEVQAQIGSAYETATSEADMERIAEQTIGLKNKLEELNKEKAEVISERKVLEHRKAQYEQTLKDMGGDPDAKYQEGTLGADKRVFEFAEKASEILGMPIVVTEKEFTSNRQNGLHRVEEDGKSVIYINPNSTTAEQGVGILAHEIGHEFKKVLTPEEWAKFEDLVLTARFGKDWANSEAYKKEIEGIQNAEKSVNGQGISDTKAREEVVTYALQTFIFDGERGARAFEAIINQDLNWRDKLMEVLRKVVDKLKALFNEQDLAVQSAIEEFGNIFKRYAESEKINKVGDAEKKAVENANATDEVSSSLALADILEGKSETYHQQNATNVPAKALVKANADIQAMVDIMRPYVDVEMYGAPVLPKEVYGKGLSTIFKNQSYGASMENTTICLRTLAYIEFVDDVKEKLGRPLTTEESFLASQMLYDIATDPQCLYCYVSLDRKAYDESFLSYLKQRDDVLKMYDAIEGRKTKKAIEEVYQTFLGGRKDTPQMKARFNMWIDAHKKGLPMIAAEDLRNTKSIEVAEQSGDANIVKQMADAKKYAQSASWAKKIEDYRAYTGELLKISDKMYQRLNNAYGLRFYSFSEYSPAFIVENMQMMRDAALKGLRGLAYTKEIEFAKIFAPTNANINISIFGRRDADGNMVADTRQGADWVEAQALRDQYPNVGLVFVATNDADVEWALAQDFIDVVIPFHIVRTGSNIADFYEWTNYKDMQEDKGGKSILPNEHNNDKETFLRLAEERGLTPRFSKWVDNPNYMKLVNETRRASKDTPFLQPIFNLDEAKASFKAFVDKGGYFGGWYNVDEQGYQEGVEQVYQDIVAGKTAKDVDYGRQDVPADALNTKRKVRMHNNIPLLNAVNARNKVAGGNAEVVSDADVVEESFSISRNNEATIDKWLGKREDFTDEVKNAFKEYIADFKPATQLATTKWYANGVIRIPEDMPKVEQAMEIAQRKKVDALQYNSPMELIEQFGVIAPKEKLINPDDVPTLSNKTQVPNTDITIYDVDDSEESRKNFRELMNSHLGKESSPWCLLQADKNGVLTKESASYWKNYNRYPKRAAFNNGKLIAFFASDGEPTWWDRMDKPHSEIPVVGKIKGDALGRTATMLVSESGEIAGYDNIHKGDKKNGLYEEWYNLEQQYARLNYRNGQRFGLQEQWHENGVLYIREEIGEDSSQYQKWNDKGVETYKSFELGSRETHIEKFDSGQKKEARYADNMGLESASVAWETYGEPNKLHHSDALGREFWRWGAHYRYEKYSERKSEKVNNVTYDWVRNKFYTSYKKGEVASYEVDRYNERANFFDDGTYRKEMFIDGARMDISFRNEGAYISTTIYDHSKANRGETIKLSIREGSAFKEATISDGKRTLDEGVTDAMVDEIMAEVTKRLDLVDMVALEVQEDSKREKARAEKIREMYHADKVADIESIEDVDKMLEQISNDLASTKESFSIDRSQYLEGIKDEEYRDWTRGKLYQIEEAVKNGLDVRLGHTISTYDKYAKKEERKAKRAKTDWDKNNAEQKVASYRAITEYGRAMMKEYFPEFIANAHADNIKSGNATLSYIEELFNKYNKNEDAAELFKVVIKTAKQIGTKVRFETLRDGSRLGEQRANLIKYDVDAMNSDTISDESKATTLLHELIHAVTASGILLVEQPSLMIRTGVTPSAQLKSAVRRLKRTFDSIKKDDAFKGTYGSTSYEEMLAELANPKFAEKLKAHDIWVRVINGIREVVLAIASIVTGKDYKTSAYAELRDTLTDIIEETPMEFVGFINVVRDETIAKNYMEAESVEEIAEPRTEQESYSILREEDTDTIFATAKEEFASTNDWIKTGWLMPDGTQLDFAEGGDYRGTDHRAIGAAYKGTAEHRWQYLQDFENRGGIRIHMNRDGKYGTIEMAIKPTAEQKKRLRSFIGAVGGNVDVDFMDENYNTAHSASYEGVSPARVLSGITNFYDEGIKPKGNVQESYSLVGVRGAKEWDDMEKALGRESIVRLDNLAVAREMETSGKNAKAIRLATGWERGVDGKWRYEMEDVFPDDIEERIKDAVKEGNKGVDLMQIIGYKHPVAVYHTPYKYKVVAFNDPNSTRWGYADSDNKVIGINVASQSENWRSIFAHELQHLIQVEEGFAIGTGTLSRSGASQEARQRYWMIESGLYDLYKLNEDAERVVYRDELLNAMHRGGYPFGGIDVYTIHFVDWLKKQETEIPIDVLQDGFQESKARAILDAYNRASGEVEARNVQKRLNYNDEQRRTTLLSETADVAPEDQIIIFEGIKGAGVAEMGSKVTKRMTDIAKQLESKKLTPAQQAVADVYMGKADNKAITFTATDGTVTKVVMRQGNELGAGTKHSIFRHYDTSIGYFTADDILLIPEIIARGERVNKQRGKTSLAEYKMADSNGVQFTVLTQIDKGREIFNDFYSNKKALKSGVFNTQSALADNNNAFSTDKDTTTNPKNQISEQESYSLNLDDEIIATPEMEAEANEELELSGEQQLMLMYATAESRFQKYKERARKQRTKTRMSKNAVIAEVQRILKDKSFKEGALNVSSGQYNKIVENVLNTIKKLPEDKEFKLEDVYYEVINNLTSARLASADAALKKAENDFKATITKKRFGKNAKGEIIQKYVDGNVQKMMEQFVGVIEHLFTHDGKVDWRKVHTIAEKDSKELDKAIAEYGDQYATEDDESSLGIYNLLLLVKDMWNAASELEDLNKVQKDIDTDIKKTEATLLNIEELLNTFNGGGREMGRAKRELKAMGYTIEQAEKAIDQLRSQLEELAKEKKDTARGEVNAKANLIETIKALNTGILSLDKLGRVALKEWNAERAEEKRVFRKGVLRSIRNPLFRNTIDYNEKDKTMKDESGKEYSRRMYRKLRRRGDSVASDITDTFDQITRKADVMSIPDAWLHSGFRYQFMLHPEKGAIARADWRYKTERGIRKTLDEKIKSVVGKKVGWERRFKNLLNEKIAHYEVVKTNSDGTIPNSADTTRHTFTVNEALYIRAAIRQDGVLRGYLTTGLTEDQVNDIVALVEREYASLCALCDWVQSEGGIMDQLYQMRNEEYKRLNGIDLPHTEQYYPIKRKADTIASEDSVGDTIPVSNLANGIGSNKARVRNNVAMDLNAGFFDVLDSHISESVQWTAYADLFDKMNTLLRSPMFKRMCKVQGLSMENLKNAFMRATGETLGKKESHWMAKLVTSATKSAVASNVAFNLNSALKQMASATMALSRDVNPELWAHFLKNFPIVSYLSTIADKPWRSYKNDSTSQFWSVVFPNIKWAYDNIPTFAERFHSDNIGLDIFKADGFETWDKISGAIKKIGMLGNRFMDLVASSAITKSIYEFEYEKNRRRGLSHEDAHNDARITAAVFMNQTQQSDQGAFLSAVQSDRKGLSAALALQSLTSYQNSQLGFDRNARYAMISLIDLTTDGANGQRIAYLTKEYEDRGLSHKDASKFAKRDLRVAILTQLNSFIHNTFVNAALWSIMPTAIIALTSYFVGEDDDERDELTLQKMVDEAIKKALSRSFVYLVPGTSQPYIKPFADIYVERGLTDWTNFDRDRAFGKDVSVGFKPLYDLFNEGQRLVSAYMDNEKFGGEKMKLELEAAGTTFGFALLDTATRYGFGLSTEAIRRMFNGFVGAYKDGNVEDWMNATTQSKTLTKLMAGRPRKGEEMKDYIERVGGMYKVINGFSKGVDESKLRKEYIERMDELLLHSNGMGYNKLKEDLKLVGDIAKERVIVTVSETKDKWGNVIVKVDPKEGYIEEYESIPDEEAGHQEELGTITYVMRLVNKDLKDNLGWDEKTASYRFKYYKELQGELDKFLKEFADYREYENNNKE